MLAEEGAVGQAGQAVVEGELGDPPLALGDAGGHAVEALRQPADLVPGLDLDLDRLALLHPLRGLIERRDRPGQGQRQPPRAEDDQDQAEQAGQRHRELQRQIGAPWRSASG